MGNSSQKIEIFFFSFKSWPCFLYWILINILKWFMIEPSSYNTATKTIIFPETSSQLFLPTRSPSTEYCNFVQSFPSTRKKVVISYHSKCAANFFPADFSSHSGDDITPVNQGKLSRDENTCWDDFSGGWLDAVCRQNFHFTSNYVLCIPPRRVNDGCRKSCTKKTPKTKKKALRTSFPTVSQEWQLLSKVSLLRLTCMLAAGVSL